MICKHCGQAIVPGIKCEEHKVPCCGACGKHLPKFVTCGENNG